MGFTNGEDIIAWNVKGKTVCSKCLIRGEKIDRALTDADCGSDVVVVCDRCHEVVCEEIIDDSARVW